LNNEKEFKTRDPKQEFIYAPYRVPDDNAELLSQELSSDCIYIAHIRNPIDILISEYYSYGFMHSESINETSGVDISSYRDQISKMSIDRYCVEVFDNNRINRFKMFYNFISKNMGKPNFFVSSYSLMKNNFKEWNSEIFSLLKLNPSHCDSLFNSFKSEFDVKPLDNNDVKEQKISRHIRNGTDKQYLSVLAARSCEIIKLIFQYHIPYNIRELPDLVL